MSMCVWHGDTIRWEVTLDEALTFLAQALQEEGSVDAAKAKLELAFNRLKRR